MKVILKKCKQNSTVSNNHLYFFFLYQNLKNVENETKAEKICGKISITVYLEIIPHNMDRKDLIATVFFPQHQMLHK